MPGPGASFLQELKRRHVVRVAIVYIAVTFAVLQAADVMVPALSLPGWITTAVAALIVLGFPVALVLAWAFQVTPDGVRRTAAAEPGAAAPALVGRRTLGFAALLLVAGLGVGWLLGAAGQPKGAAESVALESVAVLPFANLGGNPEDDYFSDGLSEELLNMLAQVEGLKVAARTSAFAFRGRNEDVREIARQLGVATVVEGSVRRQRDRVRITAQLIQASDGFHLWSETYDADMSDIFVVQDSVARAIANALRVTLGLSGTRRDRGLTENLAAYDLYLLGRHYSAQRNLSEAARYYRQAVDQDPDFALAWSGIADITLVRPFYDFRTSFADAAIEARPMVERALALSPQRGEVQATAGLLALYGDWDFPRAEQHLDRAVSLAPSYAWAYHYRRQLYDALGRYDEARADAYRALVLDPLSHPVVATIGIVLQRADSLEAALPYFQRSTAEPGVAPLYLRGYGNALVDMGRTREATAVFRRWAAAMGYADTLRADVLVIRDGTSATQAAVRALLEDIAATTPARATDLLFEYPLAGNEAFLQVAEQAVRERHYWALYLSLPQLDESIHADPRYQALLRRVGLPLPAGRLRERLDLP
jgi:TolB-like protein